MELDLVARLCDLLGPADTVITYNGERFDLLHLGGRARIAGAAVSERAHDRVGALMENLAHDSPG